MNTAKQHKPIPQVHKDSNEFYWKTIFPNSYKNRTINECDLLTEPGKSTLIIDGDVTVKSKGIIEPEGTKHFLFCNNCNTQILKPTKPRLFGSLDVGYELVYHCPVCDSKFRIYNKE